MRVFSVLTALPARSCTGQDERINSTARHGSWQRTRPTAMRARSRVTVSPTRVSRVHVLRGATALQTCASAHMLVSRVVF